MLHQARQYSFQDLTLLRFGLTTLLCVACAAKSEEPPASSTGGSSNGGSTTSSGGVRPASGGSTFLTGGTIGSGFGGSSVGTGGTTGPASGGTPATATGGSTSGASSTGGFSTATGGAPTTASGGTPTTASGGTPTTATGGSIPTGGTGGGNSACGTYAGTAKADSKIFVDGFGTSGTWKGYAYTYIYGTATVVPGKSTTVSCFTGKGLCAQGSIPADYGSGAGIGWNINQAQGATVTDVAVVAGSVQIQLAGAVAGMRVGLGPPTGEEFCYTLTATDVATANAGLFAIPVANFKQYCYNAPTATLNPPVAYAGQPIKSVQVSMPGDMAAAKTFDFCVVDVKSG